MALTDKARTVPRVHLFGTLFIVAALTIALASFFSWQQFAEHRASLDRMERVQVDQLESRLESEMNSALQHLQFSRSRTEEVLEKNITDKVDFAIQIAESIHTRESPLRPPEEVKHLIVEALRPLRFFDGRGYFFIDDMAGRFILLPTAPELEGQLAPNNRDDTGHPIMQGLIEAARKPRGEGFSRYRWYRPDDPHNMADKLAYVRYFEPYDWLIGTGDYIYEWESIQQREAIERLPRSASGAAATLRFSTAVARRFCSLPTRAWKAALSAHWTGHASRRCGRSTVRLAMAADSYATTGHRRVNRTRCRASWPGSRWPNRGAGF